MKIGQAKMEQKIVNEKDLNVSFQQSNVHVKILPSFVGALT